jgi:2'-5' RNA ligase
VEQIRTFVAIELTQGLRDSLSHLQDRLKRRVPERAVRWVRPEAIHLTLKFLGDVPAVRIESISQAVEGACHGFGRFTIEVADLGCFPNARRPRVIWVGVREPRGTLLGLQEAIEGALAELGFKPENRPFKPHLTLGRVQRRAGRSEQQRLGELIAHSEVGLLGRMSVTSLNVMRSELRPGGAVYTALARASLGRGKDDLS